MDQTVIFHNPLRQIIFTQATGLVQLSDTKHKCFIDELMTT